MIKKMAMLAGSVALAMALAAQPAAAAEKEKIDNPWTECGIGAMIFPNVPVGAVISNVIWDLGTTAVTSALSSPSTCSGHSAQAALFINKSYNLLASETAVGSGQYFSALGDVYNCSQDSRTALATRVREEVGKSMEAPGFADMDRTHKAETYYNAVDGLVRSEFAKSCTVG